MTKDIERDAFEDYEISKNPKCSREILFETWKDEYLDCEEKHYVGKYTDSFMQEKWQLWQAAKAHEAEKLKGCVMVPVRTDNEIIDQTIKLMDLLATSTNRFQRDPKCIFPFESNNPRVKEWWYVACQIQELLTNTDPTNCDFYEYKADVEATRGGNE